MTRGLVRLEPDRFAKLLGCLHRAAQIGQSHAQPGVRPMVAGLEPDRLAPLGDAIIDTALAVERDTKIEMSVGVGWTEPDRFAILFDCLREPAAFAQAITEDRVGRDSPRASAGSPRGQR